MLAGHARGSGDRLADLELSVIERRHLARCFGAAPADEQFLAAESALPGEDAEKRKQVLTKKAFAGDARHFPLAALRALQFGSYTASRMARGHLLSLMTT